MSTLDVRTHATRVDHAMAERSGETSLHRAVCACGWRGQWLDEPDAAASQADAHLDAC